MDINRKPNNNLISSWNTFQKIGKPQLNHDLKCVRVHLCAFKHQNQAEIQYIIQNFPLINFINNVPPIQINNNNI